MGHHNTISKRTCEGIVIFGLWKGACRRHTTAYTHADWCRSIHASVWAVGIWAHCQLRCHAAHRGRIAFADQSGVRRPPLGSKNCHPNSLKGQVAWGGGGRGASGWGPHFVHWPAMPTLSMEQTIPTMLGANPECCWGGGGGHRQAPYWGEAKLWSLWALRWAFPGLGLVSGAWLPPRQELVSGVWIGMVPALACLGCG